MIELQHEGVNNTDASRDTSSTGIIHLRLTNNLRRSAGDVLLTHIWNVTNEDERMCQHPPRVFFLTEAVSMCKEQIEPGSNGIKKPPKKQLR